ncbi:small multidrug resistance protein [Mycolicibacterium aurum]|uniref:Small multidrug resistance protein n=1 Tax=Mycolicibacterium aurum TaxID=1791 RepID=A0A3S4VNE7_MYCAU|nr:multidrug efflux SMR transporter [Mycolicibacterium aurum]VEG51662.1 small multidrug resistance protein [Mycolicibacterium aurum]
MAWFVLIVSAVLEAAWATALGKTDGFTAPVATAVFLIALPASLGGLAWAATHIPIGSAYAVWTGLGAALTVGYAMLSGDEAASLGRAVFLTGIIAAVVGLKLLPSEAGAPAEHDERPREYATAGR